VARRTWASVLAAGLMASACAGAAAGESAHGPGTSQGDARPVSVRAAGPGTVGTTATTAPPAPPPVPRVGTRTLIDDGGTPYRLDAGPGSVTVAMPGTGGTGNTRILFWDHGVEASVDQTSCATWTNQSGPHDQQGAALRIRVGPSGTRAITVTKGVWIWNYAFNVHLWDTAVRPGALDGIAQFVLSPALGAPMAASPDLPWRMCARAVGRRVDLLVWPLARPQPEWGDPAYGGSVALPAGWDEPGQPGWYIGHLHPHDEVGFTDLSPVVGSPAA
jgi:hypothetical protein